MEIEKKDSFFTVDGNSSYEIKIMKSKFIANSFHCSSETDVTEYLKKIKKEYFDSRHNPFSFRLFSDNAFRYNDDGEPSGSSGKPIGDAVQKHGLYDVLVVVTRYFGGVKLGIGGLKRAYFEVADGCLSRAVKKEMIITDIINIKSEYVFTGSIMNYLNKNNIRIKSESSGEKFNIDCIVSKSLTEDFKKTITEITNGSAEILLVENGYICKKD